MPLCQSVRKVLIILCSCTRYVMFTSSDTIPLMIPSVAMKLVEVIKTPRTSQETFDTLMAVAKKMEKVTVAAKDTPG